MDSGPIKNLQDHHSPSPKTSRGASSGNIFQEGKRIRHSKGITTRVETRPEISDSGRLLRSRMLTSSGALKSHHRVASSGSITHTLENSSMESWALPRTGRFQLQVLVVMSIRTNPVILRRESQVGDTFTTGTSILSSGNHRRKTYRTMARIHLRGPCGMTSKSLH